MQCMLREQCLLVLSPTEASLLCLTVLTGQDGERARDKRWRSVCLYMYVCVCLSVSLVLVWQKQRKRRQRGEREIAETRGRFTGSEQVCVWTCVTVSQVRKTRKKEREWAAGIRRQDSRKTASDRRSFHALEANKRKKERLTASQPYLISCCL